MENSCLAFLAARAEPRRAKLESKEEEELPMLRRRRQIEEVEEEDDEEDEGDFISCPPGTLYCIAMDSCVRSCDEAYEELEEEEDEEGEEEGWEVCAPGEFYCMGEGRCSKECGRQAASLWDDDDEEEDEEDWEVCLPGQVFCMEVMACVSDCGFFEEEDQGEFEDETGEGGEDGGGVGGGEAGGGQEFSLIGGSLCPEGTVYCMMSAKCQEPSQPCKSKAQEVREQCPEESRLEAGSQLVGFSTCQVSSHCPPHHSCCPFSSAGDGGRTRLTGFHCSPHNSTKTPPDPRTQLDRSCSLSSPSLTLTAGGVCSVDPSACSPGAICCDGKCRGIPSFATVLQTLQPGVCSPGSFFCNRTESCQTAGSWMCNPTCGPGLSPCMEGSTLQCGSCSQDKHTSGPFNSPVWVLPLASPGGSIVTAKLSKLWEGLPGSNEKAAFQFVVVSLSSLPTSLAARIEVESATGWQPLLVGETLTQESKLRLNSSLASNPGALVVNLKETPGDRERKLVGLVLPELAQPVFTSSLTNTTIQLLEDTEVTLNTSLYRDLLEVAEANRTSRNLTQYMEWYENVLINLGSGFLETNVSKAIASFLEKGRRPLGLSIEPLDKVEKRSDYKVKLYQKLPQEEWTLVNPSAPLELWKKDRLAELSLRPMQHFHGTWTLVFRPIVMDFEGETVQGEGEEVRVEITPVNDSPTVKASQPESLPLVPFEASDNTGMLASDVAALFYEDVDEEDNLGLAIIFTSTTTLGEWQIKGEEQGTWSPLSAPSSFPIPSDLKLARTHRGVVQVTKYLAGKLDEEKRCWSEALGEEEGKEKRSMWQTAALTSSSGGETANFSTFANLSMLLVKPDALLRFQPAQVCFPRLFFWTKFPDYED